MNSDEVRVDIMHFSCSIDHFIPLDTNDVPEDQPVEEKSEFANDDVTWVARLLIHYTIIDKGI